MTRNHDAIVLGLGAMGAAAAYHLARRGQRVLGLDAHARGHALGSSHGRTRVIREAYHEAPDYVPLVQAAYRLWRELERESGRRMLHLVGNLAIGAAESRTVAGVLESARRHRLAVESLAAAEIARRFPGFRPTDDLVGAFQPNAGYLAADACMDAHLDLALRHGARLQHGERVDGWAADGAGVRVTAGAAEYRADRLVVTAGPWAGEMLADLGLPLRVDRKYNVHFEPAAPERFAPERCPTYGWLVPEGQYYGIPALPGQGLKLGRHDGGEPCTPATARREVTASEVETLRTFLDRYMPGAAGAVKWTLTCLYTMTPDGHFVIDRHPAHPQVALACGFSGHGFKFATVVGEALADLATEGATRHPIGFLRAGRLAGGGAGPAAG